MVNFWTPQLLIWVSSISFLIPASLGFDPVDNYLIDCGSFTNQSMGDRVFVADNSSSYTLSTPQNIVARTSVDFSSSTSDSVLYQTARVFNGISHYTFPIKEQGRHWIRFHFFPFVNGSYNMSKAEFSVSAQNFMLIREPRFEGGSVVKEYCLNVTADELVVTFTPSANSFAFVNALEMFSLPDYLIPKEASVIGLQGDNRSLLGNALETVARVNMGNVTIPRQNDTLWRLWVSDDAYLLHTNLGTFVSRVSTVNITGRPEIENIAPLSVYGTATWLNTELDPRMNANLTWRVDVDPGFEYLVRLHFCDVVSNSTQQSLIFNVYINSQFASHLDLHSLTSNELGVPYYMDVITRVSASRLLNVSVGPSTTGASDPDAILNGLEIMKINNHRLSLDVIDTISSRSSRMKIAVIVGLVVGLFIVLLIAMVVILLFRRRRRLSDLDSEQGAHCAMYRRGKFHTMDNEHYSGTPIFSSSNIGYRFPLVAIQEATDNFSESLVVGIGGFGKVYKGVLRDEIKVAVKRGVPQSGQGLKEFWTEIEMVTQFRHRHLVSLLGYCDEQEEMVIIYEYMENGTLKDHLYSSNLPSLSWRQRLEICIGAARGLHYLHTGSAKAIIHRDVKSANILLDEKFMAKVADFGLSKTGPDIDKTHVSTAVRGSFGYLDPEYLSTQQLTEKSDVYSFGVVLFEVLCGRPVIDPSLPRERVNLVEWAMKLQREGKLEEIIDPSLLGQIKLESIKKFVEIAENCLAEHGIDRPSMGYVLWNLECALQLQGNGEKPGHNGETSSQVQHVDSSSTSLPTAEFSVASVGELAGISMSKVFAQMVNEETG
ncbi:hypothetical protein SLE2022_109580 [Rubroshorea leprosula]